MAVDILKAVMKKLFVNIFILSIILVLVIAVTGIPTDFDIYSYNGEYTPNMGVSEIFTSIKNNFNIFKDGEVLKVKIQGETTGQLLLKTAKKSSTILFFGTILALIIGIPKGIIDSRKKDKVGTLKLLQSLIPLSVPDILTISLVQLLAVYLFNKGTTIFGLKPFEPFGDETIKHAIFPIISISILPAAYISRIAASIIEEDFTKPYILAARGKGCSKLQIIKNHMMKSVFYEVLSGFPTVIGILFSSLIIVERMFHFRGMGFYLIYFYTAELIPAYEAGVAFTLFVVVLALYYYITFMVLNILKSVILPQIKSD